MKNDDSLEMEIEEFTEKYLRPALLEWLRRGDELLGLFGVDPKSQGNQ